MSTMRQLNFIRSGVFEWHEVTTPKITREVEATVRPLAVTRCDLDLYIATGAFAMPGPFAFGHEIAGEVVDIGSAVTSFKPGDRVIVPFQINCGDCDMCRLGKTNSCTSVPPFSAYGLAPSSGKDWGGGLSDLILVPYAEAMMVKVPTGMPLQAAAAISDNAADGYRTVAKPLKDRPGESVLIMGGLAQSVGLFAVQMAVQMQSERVVYRDFDANRLAQASAMGAETMLSKADELVDVDELFPIVVDAAGTPESLNFAIRSTAASGVCTSVSAGLESKAEIPLREMYMKGIDYSISRVHARAAIHDMLHCPKCKLAAIEQVISRSASFLDAADAMCDPDSKMVFTRQ